MLIAAVFLFLVLVYVYLQYSTAQLYLWLDGGSDEKMDGWMDASKQPQKNYGRSTNQL